jgi:hypothetical protein
LRMEAKFSAEYLQISIINPRDSDLFQDFECFAISDTAAAMKGE